MGMDESPKVFWMTRDEDVEGILSDTVDIWTEQPARLRLSAEGAGCTWIGPGTTGIEHRYAQWSLALARGNTPSGTLPDTSREAIKVG